MHAADRLNAVFAWDCACMRVMLRAKMYKVITLPLVVVLLWSYSFHVHPLFGNERVSMVVQVALCYTTIGYMRVCEVMTHRGNLKFATGVILPVFEPCLWMWINALLVCSIPLGFFPSQLNSVRARGFFAMFLASRFFTRYWLFFFASLPNCPSHPTNFVAVGIAVLTSCVQAASYVGAAVLAHSIPSHEALVWRLLGAAMWSVPIAMFASALRRLWRCSRKSFVPFYALGLAAQVGQLSWLLSQPSGYDNSRPGLVFIVLIDIASIAIVYWCLRRDTLYWRGIARVPVWAAELGESPYDALSDPLVASMPMLMNSRSLPVIDFAYLKFGDQIGVGATARVYRGEVCVGPLAGAKVAIKVFTPMAIEPITFVEVAEEANKAALRHPRIVRMHGVCVRPPDVCLVLELCANGSLQNFLQQSPLTDVEKVKLALQAVEAIEHLHTHSPSIVHRDIKADNFLVTANGDCKLSDFGTSRTLQSQNSNALVGTPHWMSPEVLRGDAMYNCRCDVYSLGIVLWEIWSGQQPYQGLNSLAQVKQHVVAGNRPPVPTGCNPEYASLMTQMWDEDPDKRPTATQCVQRLRALLANLRGEGEVPR